MSKQIKTRIQQKHDVEANWIKANNSATPFVPLLGELIIYDAETSTTDLTDTGRTTPITYERFKIGDGKTTVTNLPFAVNPHDHNDLYYTESEINTKLNAINAEIAAKAPGVHDHEISTTTAAVVKEINPGSFSKTTKYLHKTTANAAPHTHTHSVTVSGTTSANSETAVKAVTGYGSFSGGSGSLEAYDAATSGTKKVSNGTRIPVITSLAKSGYTPAGSVTLTAGTAPSMNFNTETTTDTPYISSLTKGDYTPAGSVSLTSGTAPSMGAATTKYLSASASGTAVGANGTAAAITGFGTHTTGTAIKELNTTTIKNPTITAGKAASWGASVTDGVLSFSFTANTPTAVTTSNVTVATGAKSTITPITALGAATTATCLTGVKVTAQPTISLTANTSTATGRIEYVEAQGSFTAGTTPPKSASFTGTKTNAVVTDGTTKYMKFSAGTTPKSSASFSGTKSTGVVTGGTTYYLAHNHTGASLGTATTADVAPSGHTHTFSDDATTGANSGSAVAAITGLAANTTQATGDITYVEAASHTAPSVKTTETVIKTVDIE